MAFALQIITAVVLLALGACLVPLLLQLRRTAAAVEALALSAREDLRQIAADVHQVRRRAEGLADLATEALSMPAKASGFLSNLTRGLPSLLGKGRFTLAGALLTGVRFALHWFRRRKAGMGKEKKDDR
jgi:hypothetical protein